MSTLSIKCGNCDQGVAANIIHSEGATAWLQCPACRDGSVVVKTGATWPVAPTGGSVANLPADVAQAWREARTTHAVAAYTASEMMCRKILMHLAVDVAHSGVGENFVAYINALESAGFIATGIRPAVDRIKDRGNIANHELPASTEAESIITLRITEHLLRELYELPNM